ncbi:Oidioi.mRNA.OKI2018_I69.PAR.g11276.t1.cds [Oikopleura dioica]|uniref:Oidioi.mRNA.OKI2018_I69.PAR.g11276.t1.cds n=1 Tax=Oikopleura dioica TaxID=34765 RepID=A0ABN7RZ56_OIKDI|nr:Oidioi.mRNA.OKI2018_I69.PAR.g11276.t1.cds [Oikopleura dioica]
MLVGLASTYQLAQIHGDSPLERYTRQEVNVENAGEGGKLPKEELKQLIVVTFESSPMIEAPDKLYKILDQREDGHISFNQLLNLLIQNTTIWSYYA